MRGYGQCEMFNVQSMCRVCAEYVKVENFKGRELWMMLVEMSRDKSLLRVRGAKIYAA